MTIFYIGKYRLLALSLKGVFSSGTGEAEGEEAKMGRREAGPGKKAKRWMEVETKRDKYFKTNEEY